MSKVAWLLAEPPGPTVVAVSHHIINIQYHVQTMTHYYTHLHLTRCLFHYGDMQIFNHSESTKKTLKELLWRTWGGHQILPLWLDLLALLIEVVEQTVVKGIEEMSGELSHAREDVSGTCTVLASLEPGTELTCSMRVLLLTLCTLQRWFKLTDLHTCNVCSVFLVLA